MRLLSIQLSRALRLIVSFGPLYLFTRTICNPEPASKIQIADVEGPPSVRFPTISICSHNMVSKSYFDSKPGLEDLWSTLDRWDVDEAKTINFSDPLYARLVDRKLMNTKIVWIFYFKLFVVFTIKIIGENPISIL